MDISPNIDLRRSNSTEIQHQLIEMGFELNLLNNVLINYEIVSLEQAIEYLTKDNGKWNHPYINLLNDGISKENLCVICHDVYDNHIDNSINDIPISIQLPQIENLRKSISKEFDDKPIEINEIEPKLKFCNICLGHIDSSVYLECLHEYCLQCFREYLINKINTSDVELINCPEVNCDIKITNNLIKNHLLEKDYVRYEKFLARAIILKIPGRILCPIPDCDSYAQDPNTNARFNDKDYFNTEVKLTIEVDNKSHLKSIDSEKKNLKKNDLNFLKCLNGHDFCIKCNLVAHAGFNCEKNKENGFIKWIGKNSAKQCPECKFWIEKNLGCNHMKCANKCCNYEFCWICLGKYETKHFSSILSPCYGLQNSGASILMRFPCLRYLKFVLTPILAIIIFVIAVFLSTPLFIFLFYFNKGMVKNILNYYQNENFKILLGIIMKFFALIISIPLLPVGWMICALVLIILPIILLIKCIKKCL